MERRMKVWLTVLIVLLIAAIAAVLGINSQLSGSKNALEAASTQLAGELEKVETLTADYESVSAQLAEAQQSSAAMETQLTQAQTQLAEAEAQLSQSQEKFADLEKQLSTAETEKQQHADEKQVAQSSVDALEAAAVEYQARIAELANAQPEPTPVELPFTDVAADAWYHDAVSYVYANGLMNGMSPDTFAPQDTTTRAMIVTLLYRMSGSPAVTGSNPFTDVEAGRYSTKAVIWAAENGIVKGVSADTFQPDGAVTREQIATFLYRYAAFRGYDVSARADLSRYSDAEQVSNYAKDAMSWAVAAGIISGNKIDGAVVLDAQGAANRAQIATVLMRFCESVAK